MLNQKVDINRLLWIIIIFHSLFRSITLYFLFCVTILSLFPNNQKKKVSTCHSTVLSFLCFFFFIKKIEVNENKF